jgi:hypothetical protein
MTTPVTVSFELEWFLVLSYLHDCATLPQCQGNTFLVFKSYSPDSFALGDEFSNEMSSFEIPNLDSTITTTAHDSSIIKLQTGDTIVMSCKTVDWAHLFQ